MQEPSPLFRPAAAKAQRTQALGEIILVQPVSFRLLTAVAVGVAAVIVGFFLWGSYTEHSTLSGQLVPDLGVIKVYTPQYGTIVEKHVDEGDVVSRDDVLYAVSSERLNSALGATQELIGRELEARRHSLEEQIEKTRILEQTDRDSLAQMIAGLRSEAENLRAMIDSQNRRVELAEQATVRYERLWEQGFVSEEHVIAKQEDLLEQRSRLQGVERENSNAARQLADFDSQMIGLPLKYQNQMAELERAISGTRQELTENEARRRVMIVAPEGGIATAVLGELGQVVDGGKPLLSIVPHDAELQAHLYGPSRAVGFVNVGNTVLLRYQAYPYQKFGHHEGIVSAVSRTALPVAELTGSAPVSPNGGGEPMYRITVDIESQTIDAYGEPRLLQAGMAVQADVLQETRRLYEWVLEPLYTLTGRLH